MFLWSKSAVPHVGRINYVLLGGDSGRPGRRSSAHRSPVSKRLPSQPPVPRKKGHRYFYPLWFRPPPPLLQFRGGHYISDFSFSGCAPHEGGLKVDKWRINNWRIRIFIRRKWSQIAKRGDVKHFLRRGVYIFSPDTTDDAVPDK